MIELPSAFAEPGVYPPGRALPGSPRQCSLPLACRHPPEGHQIGARKRRTPGNTILRQPYRRRVSTDRTSREDSQLAASLEGKPDLTSAGTPPHTQIPKPGLGGRGHEDSCVGTAVVYVLVSNSRVVNTVFVTRAPRLSWRKI